MFIFVTFLMNLNSFSSELMEQFIIQSLELSDNMKKLNANLNI